MTTPTIATVGNLDRDTGLYDSRTRILLAVHALAQNIRYCVQPPVLLTDLLSIAQQCAHVTTSNHTHDFMTAGVHNNSSSPRPRAYLTFYVPGCSALVFRKINGTCNSRRAIEDQRQDLHQYLSTISSTSSSCVRCLSPCARTGKVGICWPNSFKQACAPAPRLY